jgi:hypothetical protein
MVSFSFWQRWLQGICLLVISLGLLMAFLIGTDAFSMLSDPIDDAFFDEALTAAERDFQAWAYGVWGATMVGWGIVLMFIARGPFKRKELWSWQAFLVGLLAWFIIDTAFSALYDVTINVIVNVSVLLLALLPLLATYKEFRPAAA